MFENGFVNLYTTDMERSLKFYKDSLGFTETFRVPHDHPDHVELDLNGLGIALSTVAAAEAHQGVEATPGVASVCLVIWTTDLERAYAALIDAGTPVVLEPHAAGNGNTNALLRDPDGNLVELVAKTEQAGGVTTVAQLQVNLFCEDVERCLAFYLRLGLPEAFRYPKTGPIEHVEVEAAGVRIGLTSATTANSLADLGVDPSGDPSVEVVLWSDDTDELFACAVAAGAAVVTEPMDSPDRRIRYAWVRDPDGHQVKLVQKR